MTGPDGTCYEIRIDGLLDQRWSAWFGGLTISHADGVTILRGAVTDQSQLHGLLARIRDLGVTLISVSPLDDDSAGTTAPSAADAALPPDSRDRAAPR